MATVDRERNEICCKLLYFGAEGAGKGTNLAALLQQTSSSGINKNHAITLARPQEPFRFLPLSLGAINNYLLKAHIYTIPNNCNALPILSRWLCTGVDGLVFVADSRRQRLKANTAAWREMQRTLWSQGVDLARLPLVVQFNKRDLEKISPIEELRRQLAMHRGAEVPAIAQHGVGTLESLHTLINQVISKLSPSKG